VVNINTERVVRRTVRDPFEDFYAAIFLGITAAGRARFARHYKVSALASIVDEAGYSLRTSTWSSAAADLKIQVMTNDGKTYNAHYITGDDKKDLAFIKIDAKGPFPFINLDNISPNLLGETVIVVGQRRRYGSSISRGVLSATKRDITNRQRRIQRPGANRRRDQSGKQRRPARRYFRTPGWKSAPRKWRSRRKACRRRPWVRHSSGSCARKRSAFKKSPKTSRLLKPQPAAEQHRH